MVLFQYHGQYRYRSRPATLKPFVLGHRDCVSPDKYVFKKKSHEEEQKANTTMDKALLHEAEIELDAVSPNPAATSAVKEAMDALLRGRKRRTPKIEPTVPTSTGPSCQRTQLMSLLMTATTRSASRRLRKQRRERLKP